MRTWFCLAAVTAALAINTGCKQPEEAPLELGDLTTHLFTVFQQDDAEELKAGVVQLEGLLADKDFTASVADRTVSLPILDTEAQGGVPAPAEADPTLQVPIGQWGQGTFGVEDYIGTVADPNQICYGSDSTKYAGRTFVTDAACFVDGSCDTLETTNEVRVETFIAKVWMDLDQDFKRFDLDDGRTVMVSTQWAPTQALADGGGKSWDQRYALDVFIGSADGSAPTLRYYALWSSVTNVVGDDIYATLVRDGIGEYMENTDSMLESGECPLDRDREYDRE